MQARMTPPALCAGQRVSTIPDARSHKEVSIMTTAPTDITRDEVRERIRAAGVPIPEERLALVHGLLRDALRPIRALDTREALTLEPAPTFDAAAERDRHEQR
jgi:hypothetical protein